MTVTTKGNLHASHQAAHVAVETLGNSVRPPVANGLNWLMLAMKARSERRALGRLDQRALQDLGISVSDATHEAQRPFWDLPSSRRS